MRCAVFSDDLTGAHNIGVEFAQYGYRTRITQRSVVLPDVDVLIVNTDTRYQPPSVAHSAVQDGVRALLEGGAAPDVFVKKIDSLLRGNIGAEIDALLDATAQERCLIAVASPRLGRTTIGGHQLNHGVPVVQVAELDPTSSVKTAHIPTVLGEQSERVTVTVPLHTDAQNYTAPGHYVADAATVHDLRHAVEQAYAAGVRCFAGTYGLGDAICRVLAPRVAPVLVVVGSLSSTAQAQARSLGQRSDCACVTFNPSDDDWTVFLTRLDMAAKTGKHTLVHFTGEFTPTAQQQQQLGAAFQSMLAQFGGFIATGGATAQMLLQLLDATLLDVLPIELFPGTPAAVLRDGAHAGKPFLAKPGAQGDENALDILLQYAQTMQRTSP